jgi:hypothetical protein
MLGSTKPAGGDGIVSSGGGLTAAGRVGAETGTGTITVDSATVAELVEVAVGVDGEEVTTGTVPAVGVVDVATGVAAVGSRVLEAPVGAGSWGTGGF